MDGNQSGIKSRSTLKGGASNFNEIRFDDTKGKELFSMQAEKDMKLLVKANRSACIGGSQTESVGWNQKITVAKDHSEEIGGCMRLTVEQAKNECVYLASSEEVGLAKNVTVGAAYTVEVVGAMNEAVGGAKATEVGLAHKEIVGKERSMKVGTKLTLDADEEIEVKTGAASLTMKKDGKIVIKGIDVTLESGQGTVKIDAGGIISIKGPMVKINT
jgi:type VI secretion system secreted protein VgrG